MNNKFYIFKFLLQYSIHFEFCKNMQKLPLVSNCFHSKIQKHEKEKNVLLHKNPCSIITYNLHLMDNTYM